MPASAVKSSVPRLSDTIRWWDLAIASMRKKPAADSTSTANCIAAGWQISFGFQFLDDVGDRQDVFGAVHLGQHQRRDARDHGGLQIAHQQAPRAVDPDQHVAAVARDLWDGIGDQGACAVFLRRRDGVFQVEDDAIRAAVGTGAARISRR